MKKIRHSSSKLGKTSHLVTLLWGKWKENGTITNNRSKTHHDSIENPASEVGHIDWKFEIGMREFKPDLFFDNPHISIYFELISAYQKRRDDICT